MENTRQSCKSTGNYNSAQRKYGTMPEQALMSSIKWLMQLSTFPSWA